MPSSTRLNAALQSLNGAARRVYEAVPTDEPMTAAQVRGELRRLGANYGLDVVQACLTTVKEKGLLREPSPCHYVRIQPKPATPKMTKTAVTADAKPAAEPAKPAPSDDVLTQIGQAADALRRQAAELDALAVAIAERLESVSSEIAKFRQLKAILTA